MATSKINNPHVPGSVIAESSGNKTRAQHLSALYSAYNALSQDERKRCAVVMASSDVYRIFDTGSTPAFSLVTGAFSQTSLTFDIIRISDSTANYTRWTINTSGATVADKSGESLNSTVKLVYGI